jgi:hypothetical protein
MGKSKAAAASSSSNSMEEAGELQDLGAFAFDLVIHGLID